MKHIAFGLMIILLAACAPAPATITEPPPTYTAIVPATAAPATPMDADQNPVGKCPLDEGTDVDAASVLVPGPINGVPASTAGGERLVVIVTVLDGDCQPAEGAAVQVWHTDAAGLYAPADSTEECCMFGGTVRSDAHGRFRLDTIRPAGYAGQDAPAHIHMDIEHSVGHLQTEFMFEGDKYLPSVIGNSFQIFAIRLTKQTDDAGPYWFGRLTITLIGN